MGTSARIIIHDKDETEIVHIQAGYDGYPEGIGKQLMVFCDEIRVECHTPRDSRVGHTANGMGCFAAQLIAHLKECVGSIFIVPPTTERYENYTYNIYQCGHSIRVMY